MEAEMTEKYTPGPWSVDPRLHLVRGGPEDGHGYVRPIPLATGWISEAWQGEDSTEESRANARLVAAAPDMLRAMRHAFSCIAFPVSTEIDPRGYSLHVESERLSYAAEVLSEALSKAEGRS